MQLVTSTLALLVVHSSTTTSAMTTCKTMSLNVRTSNAADAGRGSWDARKPHVKRLFLAHKPDFVGTQEASPAQYEFLKAVDGYGVIGECAGACANNERPFILYNRDDWALIESGDFALSDSTEQLGSNTWGLEYNRGATWGRFRSQSSDATVCVFNTHYDMAKGHTQSSAVVARKMVAHCQEHDLAMLTGDFNTDLGSEALQFLLGKTHDKSKSGSTFPLVSALDKAGATGGTFIGNGVFQGALSTTRFDFVFAKADNLCIQKGEIMDERFDGNNAISDHAPVMTTFCIGNDCTDCVDSGAYDAIQRVPSPAPEQMIPTPTQPVKVETPKPTDPASPVVTTVDPTNETPKPTEPVKIETPVPVVATTAPALTPAPTESATPAVTPAPAAPAIPTAVNFSGGATTGKPSTPNPSEPMHPDCDASSP